MQIEMNYRNRTILYVVFELKKRTLVFMEKCVFSFLWWPVKCGGAMSFHLPSIYIYIHTQIGHSLIPFSADYIFIPGTWLTLWLKQYWWRVTLYLRFIRWALQIANIASVLNSPPLSTKPGYELTGESGYMRAMDAFFTGTIFT